MTICAIIPSLNLAEKLKKCLGAILLTDFKNVEIIIVDNASNPSLSFNCRFINQNEDVEKTLLPHFS